MAVLYKTLRGINFPWRLKEISSLYPVTISVLNEIYTKLQPFFLLALTPLCYMLRLPVSVFSVFFFQKHWIHLQYWNLLFWSSSKWLCFGQEIAVAVLIPVLLILGYFIFALLWLFPLLFLYLIFLMIQVVPCLIKEVTYKLRLQTWQNTACFNIHSQKWRFRIISEPVHYLGPKHLPIWMTSLLSLPCDKKFMRPSRIVTSFASTLT